MKLCDFGFARALVSGQQLTDYVATRWYRAPELLVGDTNYGQPVDVWAIGCVLAELIRGEPLWPGKSDVDQLHLIRCTLGQLSARHLAVFRNNQYFAGVTLPELPSGQPTGLRGKFQHPVDEAALDLLRQSLHKEPSSRPTAETMLRHPYFDRLSLPEALEREHRLVERHSPARYVHQSANDTLQSSAAAAIVAASTPNKSKANHKPMPMLQPPTAQQRRLNSLLPQLPNGSSSSSSSLMHASDNRNYPLHALSHSKLGSSFDQHGLTRSNRMEHLPNL